MLSHISKRTMALLFRKSSSNNEENVRTDTQTGESNLTRVLASGATRNE